MKFRSAALITFTALQAFAAPSWAQSTPPGTVIIDIAGYPVPVVAGGLYDRYRGNPPLSVIAAERPGVDLSWFQTVQKTLVNIGFDSWTPNFFYVNNSITMVVSADLAAVKKLIPAAVLQKVQPLQVTPGRAVIAITAYRYEYCDNDTYNEVSISVATNKPGTSPGGPITLLTQQAHKNIWGYVLKLPVNTELARVRGVVGYNLPKWLTPINYSEGATSVTFQVRDASTGNVDITLEGKKLTNLSTAPDTVTNNFTNVNQQGALTYGYSVTRQQSGASTLIPSSSTVKLTLGTGTLSTFLKPLKLGTALMYEYTPKFQLMLHAPQPLNTLR